MKLRLLMVQKRNPRHFKLPASLSLLASLPRSLSNSCVLKSHFRKLRWLFSHTFCVSEYNLWQERCQYVCVEKKKIVDTKRKRKHRDNLYSLCYCAFFGVLLVNDQFTLFHLHFPNGVEKVLYLF